VHLAWRAGAEADHIRITRDEAIALLAVVRAKAPLPAERARNFARAVLELDPLGKLALAVLDGGPFMSTRLVELAAAFLDASESEEGGQRQEEKGTGS
jgi:hypothetical protein